MQSGDTIAAISTPPGEGAVALIRISGPGAIEILEKVFEAESHLPVPRRATLGRIAENGAAVDQVLATVFPAPASYTGENMAEIGCHGGILLAAHILELILRQGARAAEPGEFTQRAYLNGKLELTRAEAVMDLISARTPLALRAAAEQLQGRIGEEADAIRAGILEIVAHLEAWIDFPEEGIDPAAGESLLTMISAAGDRIASLLATAESGRVLREGVRVAIVGPPNAGKSSLLNRLLGMERAIVSPIPGTTRDTIEEAACLRGILFRLTDTAGLRETTDPVEREGVARARRTIEQADLVLHVVDASIDFQEPALREREILVANKVDLVPGGERLPAAAIGVSSKTGEGFPELVEAMLRETCGSHLSAGQSLASVNARHKTLLESAASSLKAATALLESGAPPEIPAIELRTALDAVGRITGSADTEEILEEIFGRFCIGK
ncbi:MAG: tRNA uridine-5-carboxymethylaminomethyl(34) synthesis GTPase MnmE [Verrucomicrobiaceae bacterium]|nr:MAG: tRNA uridine-5-carboxymethylaminomethyl(34) synthesis GTPase MnmE [Verrucomicrobiaceae bacterium]